MPQYNKRKIDTYVQAAFRGAGHAKKAYGLYQNYKKFKPNPKRSAARTAPKVLTKQHDVRVRRTRKQSKKQRRWNNYVTKVKKAVAYNKSFIALTEKNTVLFTSTTTTGRANQNVFETDRSLSNDLRLGAYKTTKYSATGAGPRRFIKELQGQVTTTNGFAQQAPVNANERNTEFFIKGCSETVCVKNLWTEDIFVDIYECVSRMDIDDNTSYDSAYNCWEKCLTDSVTGEYIVPDGPVSWAKLATQSTGATPYAAPRFGKYWKILKKTRTLISPTSKVNYTMIGYKGKVSETPDMDNGNAVPAGKVKDLIIVVNPTFNEASATGQLAELQWSKSYSIEYNGQFAPESTFTGAYNY